MGRIIARFFAVISIGGGVGLLTWGISSGPLGEQLTEKSNLWGLFPSASAVIGWGAGILAVGVTTLALTFVDRHSDDSWDE
jgi:hypothetical protein